MSAADLVILGGGGHARVVHATLRLMGARVLGFTDPAPERAGLLARGVVHLGTDDALGELDPRAVELVNGIGSTGRTSLRASVFQRAYERGFRFRALRHPSAVVADDAELGPGVQVMAGAIVQTGARVGANVLINTGAIVDHDCVIADHVHVAPGAVLSGQVILGEGAHVGAGATVRQGARIGARALVGAGAVVVGDVDPGCTVVGVPARPRQPALRAGRGAQTS